MGGPAGSSKETAQKAGLEDFYQDILRFGCLRVFRHFSLYLRGREELLVTVRNADFFSPSARVHKPTTSGRSDQAAWRNHQRKACQGPLPPASPAASELKQTYAGETLFLIGAYARYKFCPYVWLRSNHSQSSAPGFDPDIPLLLQTTKDWKNNSNLRIWDVVEELVDLNASSQCENPFEVDFAALRDLAPMDRACMAAAMASFLETLLASSRPPYAAALKSDLRQLVELHFKDMAALLSARTDTSGLESQAARPTTYRI